MEKKLSHYEIRKEQLNEQGYLIYTAWDLQEHKEVTLIGLLPTHQSEYMQRFVDQGQRLQRLRSENVVQCLRIIPTAEIDENCYLVFEYVGDSLEERLRSGPIESQLGRVILQDALSGLRALHSEGQSLVELRPRNILISAGGRAKLYTFHAQRRGTFVVDAAKYLPSQCWEQSSHREPWMDLYVLGHIMYESFVGREHFEKEIRAQVGRHDEYGGTLALYKAWHDDLRLRLPPLHKINKSINPNVSHVVERLMSKKKERRYQSTNEALHELGVPTARADGTIVVPPQTLYRDWVILAGAAILGFTLMVIIMAVA